MKKTLLLLISTLAITACAENKNEIINIPLTSSSEEAISLFTNTVFQPKEAYRTYNPVIDEALKKCVELDTEFSLAQALIGSVGYRITPEERREKNDAQKEHENKVFNDNLDLTPDEEELLKKKLEELKEDFENDKITFEEYEKKMEDCIKKYDQ